MPFKKGQSGNAKGRPRDGTSWAAVLEKIGGEKVKVGKDEITKKEAVARKLWAEASKGQPWAINALMDRLDGKPKQVIDQTIETMEVPRIELSVESEDN